MTHEAHEAIARKLHEYFRLRLDDALRAGRENLAPVPSAAAIHAMIEAAFWTSLRREEGYPPQVSLAFLGKRRDCLPIVLGRPLRLTAEALARVSPAVVARGMHLGVCPDGDGFCVWGMTRNIPLLCFVLEVVAPGLLVVKHPSGPESNKFVNVAVLEGDQVKLIDAQASGPRRWIQSPEITVKLAVAMRAHGRGGSLLMVPAGTDSWRDSIIQPMLYAVASPSCEFASMTDTAIEAIAGLTAVDGAVVLTDRGELLGFGAKIMRRRGSPMVEEIYTSEPVEGAVPATVHPEQVGGTRHFSAAQFIHDQRDAAALVASQDGRFTIFEWNQGEQMVHAYRLDALLL